MKDRFRKLIIYSNTKGKKPYLITHATRVNASEFARTVGLNRGTVINYASGKSELSTYNLRKIKGAIPELNLNWLIVGEDKMIIQSIETKLLEEDNIKSEFEQEDPEEKYWRNKVIHDEHFNITDDELW